MLEHAARILGETAAHDGGDPEFHNDVRDDGPRCGCDVVAMLVATEGATRGRARAAPRLPALCR